MSNHKRFILVIILLLALIIPFSSMAQLPEGIKTAFETGDSKALAEYFNENVELVVLENDNVYSKAQARQILNDFFSRYPIQKKGFSILHQGGKEGSKSVIGSLLTTKGGFRVYFLLKTSNGREYIHRLRIEKK